MRNFMIWLFYPLFARLTAYMGRNGLILYGSGGDDPDPVDYTPMAQASEKAAQLSHDLGQEQLAESRRQYENNMAVAAPVVEAQLGLMKSQKEQGDSYYKDYTETYKPISESLAADAANFSTAGAKETYARTAAADLEQQQANEAAQTNRSLSSMGVNPNSAKFVALQKQSEITNAGNRAGAVTKARTDADDLSWNKRMQVAGLGSALVGASQNSYSGSTNAGTSAVRNNAQAGNSLVAGTAAASGTTLSGVNTQIQGLGSILSSKQGLYNAQLGANSSASAGTGQLIGTGIMAAATFF